MTEAASTNPLANLDQFAAERAVAAMRDFEIVRRARQTVEQLFMLGYGCDTSGEDEPARAAAMDEFVTNYLFKAAASDAAHPRLVRDFMPSYTWDGRTVPGARMGGDNPDNCYRLAGIAHGGRYRIVGRPTGPQPAQTSLTLTANYGTSVTVQTLESADLHQQPDGSFEVTIDDQPAGGRRNHLTTAPAVKFLFIRESFEDWSRECSFDLSIKRLDPITVPPLTIEEIAQRATARAIEEVPLYVWFQRLFSGLPINSFRPPANSASLGGLVTQAGVQGWYRLAEDEAVLVRYQPAGAAYVSLALADWWFRSLDADQRQSSLTRNQSIVDADGWISVVVSRRDPGIANWLDAGDRPTVLFFARWQGLPGNPMAGGPAMEATVMKLDALPDALRANQAVTPAARAAQLAARRAAWQRRITP